MDSSHFGYGRRTFLLKSKSCIEIGLAAVLTPWVSSANETQQVGVRLSPLSARQEVLAKQLEGKLIAPCCFSQTVADHYSDAAAHIKQQIRQLLAEGQSEDQILDAYVRVYGERILAAPRATGFNLLAYLAPPIVLLAGISGMALWLTHLSHAGQRRSAIQQQVGLAPNDARNRFKDRLRDELSRFAG